MSLRELIILGSSSQQPTRYRNHGGYLCLWNGEGLLFDPGEGTQRQFIFADVAPPKVNRIFISHFHGDHCLGLGSMLMRLNLDKVSHPIHCYYPASGKKYFDRLRYCCIYHEKIRVIEHPIKEEGIIEEGPSFRIECAFLDHGVENIGWRITEPDTIRFDREKLLLHGVTGPSVKELERKGFVTIGNRQVDLAQVSTPRPGAVFAYVVDTRPCPAAKKLAQGATLLLCESTYLDRDRDLALEYAHMTARQAAELALAADAKMLILTHFSARYRDVKELEEEARQIFPESYAAEDLLRFPIKKLEIPS